jgi:hypothetical protein
MAKPARIAIELASDERIALRRFANDIGEDLETAAQYRAAGLADAYRRAGVGA